MERDYRSSGNSRPPSLEERSAGGLAAAARLLTALLRAPGTFLNRVKHGHMYILAYDTT